MAINLISRTINQLHSQLLLSRSAANTSNKSKGLSPSVAVVTGAWAVPYGVGNEACGIKPAVIPAQRGAQLCGSMRLGCFEIGATRRTTTWLLTIQPPPSVVMSQ